MALSQIVKNAAGAVTSVGWSFPNGQSTVSDTVVRSQSENGTERSIVSKNGGTPSTQNKRTYDVTVEREGRWWVFEIPELDTAGQARNLAAGHVARSADFGWLGQHWKLPSTWAASPPSSWAPDDSYRRGTTSSTFSTGASS